MLALTAFASPLTDLPDRLAVTMTMVLTVMAFKFVITDNLPKAPYLTLMDKYIVSTLVCLFMQGIVFAVVYEYERHVCAAYGTSWWTGSGGLGVSGRDIAAGATDHGLDATTAAAVVAACEGVTRFDRVFFILNILFMVAEHVYIMVQHVRQRIKLLTDDGEGAKAAIDEDFKGNCDRTTEMGYHSGYGLYGMEKNSSLNQNSSTHCYYDYDKDKHELHSKRSRLSRKELSKKENKEKSGGGEPPVPMGGNSSKVAPVTGH